MGKNLELSIYSKYLPHLIYFIDEACHLVFCPPGNTKTLEGCAGSENVYSYADQLTRDYPSFSQVRKVINEKSKFEFLKMKVSCI